MMETVLCIFIFVRAIVRKEYRYMSVSVLTVLYFLMLSALQNPNNAAHADILGLAEKVLLVVLTAVLIYCAKPDAEGKRHVVPAILSGVACIIRFVRSAFYDLYTEMMIQSGADVTGISNELICNDLCQEAKCLKQRSPRY